MTFPPLTVIEASAGTGKTFSLVTRLLRLVFSVTEPERVIALTFSRMAAGEIFNSFIKRLADAAEDPQSACEESDRLAVGRTLTVTDFAEKLRLVIARQHLSLIGTLDSFLMRVVRMIPLELGLEGEVSVMSDYRSPVERARLVGEMLSLESEDAKTVFRDAFRLAFGGVAARSFLESFSGFIEDWHDHYRENDRSDGWGRPETIWPTDRPKGLDAAIGEVRARAALLDKFAGKRGADTFIRKVAEFPVDMPDKLPKCMEGDADAEETLRLMRVWKIARELKSTQGVYRLMHAYEASYAVNVRQKGHVAFEDLPRLLNGLGEGVRLPLEYRMDARFDHWALDEFQDTSRDQWKALGNLIAESRQSDRGKSVFIVGDRKQSIYDWRGGDVRILGELVNEAQKDGQLETLDESRRYPQEISDAVNRVFSETVIRGALDMDGAPENALWKFRDHVSHDQKTRGFVEVIQAEKAENSARISDFFVPIENALKAVRPWERGITTAILVRKNEYGEAILSHLKAHGIEEVVFEGDSNIADSPALAAMAELVKLAEHADDLFAYAHIRQSPLATALYPKGLPPADELSAGLLADFTRVGLVRKFRDVREALKKVPGSWNEFTEARFEDFIKCVAEFEVSRDATMRLSDFIAYLDKKKRRDYAEPGKVRIMTVHQSKGLGFEWVIVPFFESDALTGGRHVGPLENESPKWILSNPGEAVDATDRVLAAAERRRRQAQRYNALCLCYVAMTRSKRALTLILHPLNKEKPASPERFSDLVRLVGLSTDGKSDWYLDYSKSSPSTTTEGKAQPPCRLRSPRLSVVKSRPSESYFTGLSGDRLFSEDFGSAAQRGSELHARYQQIEWLEASSNDVPKAFRAAFVKPSADATVWRERSYEIFADGKWETGQFDRVVFTGAGSNRTATLYDFKTNVRRYGETPDDFADRMRSAYGPQMAAYRRALSRLTGLPLGQITCKLLLVSTEQAIDLV